ncbi:UNVERIFIED_CONTAM: hypothetical protein Sradi_2983500 [Sesamum radiatum]|uniref:Uncharacterized protein n=1 Tax=Sesamum radiatum TaxID=300843 RepID=A0AAW2S0C4_SESRA
MTERFGVTCKVAPRAAGYQGQHLSCEWVIEASTLRPRNPTHETCYRVQAVHEGPLTKDERPWDDAALWANIEAMPKGEKARRACLVGSL